MFYKKIVFYITFLRKSKKNIFQPTLGIFQKIINKNIKSISINTLNYQNILNLQKNLS